MTDSHQIANIAALTDRGVQRTKNEDAILAAILPDGTALLAVADGVGGAQGGDIASREAIEALHDELYRARLGDPADALLLAFDAANDRVRSGATGERSGMATTLVAALVRDGLAWVAHAGDSRASIVRDGRLEQLTTDHSLVAEQVLAGVLTDEEAESSEYRNVITRAVGIGDRADPDITSLVEVPPGGTLLLYSDGLYRVVGDEEISQVASLASAESIARELVDGANRAGGPDNISVAVYLRAGRRYEV